jgi:hypothetical protein
MIRHGNRRTKWKTMKTRLNLIWPSALLVLSALNAQVSIAHAQGTAFSYQGRLQDGGSLANGSYDFRFRLYLDPDGNTQAGTAVLTNGVWVTNGLFTTTVDFGQGLFTGVNYWLEVDVRTNNAAVYVNLNPLQPLTPAPYAIYATAAGNLNGTVASTSLSGTYANPVTFNNSGNSFSGDGSGLTGLNASQLSTGTVPAAALNNAWKITGNGGTTAGVNFIGTADDQPLELHVNGRRAWRLEPGVPGEGGPNVIGGAPGNFVSNNVVGATIAGGGATNYSGSYLSNSVSGDFGTVGGGDGNRSGNLEATVSGGGANTASGQDATVGGGFFHTASGDWATVSGGFENTASGEEAAVGGGLGNMSSGPYGTVGGGSGNTASGFAATAPGGSGNIAGGSNSFAAGQKAFAANPGAFVWADSQNATYLSDRDNQFKIRAGGGVVMDVSGSSGLNPAALLVNSTSGNGVGLYVVETSSDASFVVNNAGAGSIIKGFNGGGAPVFEVVHDGTVYSKGIALTSDRNAKQNFQPVNPETVLDKVAALPISRWNYKTDRPDVRHVGPTAQDFHAAFGLDGCDDKHISVVDEGGVALAAIQGLNQRVRQKDAEIAGLEQAVAELKRQEAENVELKQRLTSLENLLRHQPQISP